jgi:osmoprotectant transport system substrate-binding protein
MAAIAAITLAAVAACSSSSSSSSSSAGASASSSNPLSPGGSTSSVVIGSANFPENELLATVYAQALQAKGIKVTTKLNIGAREVYYPQVEKGTISIIPEYNGTLLTVEVDKTSTAKTTAQVDAALAAKLPSSLQVLNPAPAQDSDSITVTQATANKDHLKSIADLKPYAANMVLGAPPEFKTRTDGIAGLKAVYGLTFKSFDPLDESGPLTLAALQSGKVQAADVFTTTPQIVTDKLVSLADPRLNSPRKRIPLDVSHERNDRQRPQRDRRQADHGGPAADGQRGHHGARELLHRRGRLPAGRGPELTGVATGPFRIMN